MSVWTYLSHNDLAKPAALCRGVTNHNFTHFLDSL